MFFIFTAALQALKRKKRYEKQLQQIDGTLSTIEMQREALEGANTNTAVLTTMKGAADALKAAHKHMYVSDFITFCHFYPHVFFSCRSFFLLVFNQFTWKVYLKLDLIVHSNYLLF